MLSFLPRESHIYPLGKNLAASKRKHLNKWLEQIMIHIFSHNEKARDGSLQTCVQFLKYIRTKIPMMLLAFPLWSHIRHQRSRQCSCILSRRRGSSKEKGYITRHVCFMRISKVLLKDLQQLSASAAWLLIDGKKLASQPLRWEGLRRRG